MKAHIFYFAVISSLLSLVPCTFAEETQSADVATKEKQPENVVVEKKLDYKLNDFRNFFGLCWSADSAADILAYATQMGHTHVIYKSGMEENKLSNGMFFFYEDPEFSAQKRFLNFDKKYSEKEIDRIQKTYVVLFHDQPFPENMAVSWFIPPNTFSLTLDFQQQRVIDQTVDVLMKRFKRITTKNPNFIPAGFTWDVPHPTGNFRVKPSLEKRKNPDIHKAQGREVSLAHWTGKDSSIPFKDCTHDYETYSEGKLAFYDALRKGGLKFNPNFKLISEPYDLYASWVKRISPELIEKMKAKGKTGWNFDFLWSESNSLNFLNNEKLKAAGYENHMLGSSTPNISDTKRAMEIAATAAINGSWTCWYGRAGGTGNSPDYKYIREIPARLKLLKAIATWENLNNTPLSKRTWDGKVYSSPTAYMSENVIWAINPKSKKMFAVFLSKNGKIALPKDKKAKSAFVADGLFRELMNIDRDGKIKRIRYKGKNISLITNDLINDALIFTLEEKPEEN